MAGVKGKCGGPRPNSGGARPGAGRKPNPKPDPAVNPGMDPLEFLEGVMQGTIEATALQVRAAVAAAQYRHTKKGDGGKKDERDAAAGKVASGKFGSAEPPRLVSSR